MPWWPFSKDISADWKIDTLPIPWDARRPSIHDHVVRHIEPGRDCLREGGDILPDDEVQNAGRQLRFAPGAFDGAFGHHASGNEEALPVEKALDLLQRTLRTPT